MNSGRRRRLWNCCNFNRTQNKIKLTKIVKVNINKSKTLSLTTRWLFLLLNSSCLNFETRAKTLKQNNNTWTGLLTKSSLRASPGMKMAWQSHQPASHPSTSLEQDENQRIQLPLSTNAFFFMQSSYKLYFEFYSSVPLLAAFRATRTNCPPKSFQTHFKRRYAFTRIGCCGILLSVENGTNRSINSITSKPALAKASLQDRCVSGKTWS